MSELQIAYEYASKMLGWPKMENFEVVGFRNTVLREEFFITPHGEVVGGDDNFDRPVFILRRRLRVLEEALRHLADGGFVRHTSWLKNERAVMTNGGVVSSVTHTPVVLQFHYGWILL